VSSTPTPSTGKSRDEIAEAYRSEPWWYDVRGFFILLLAYNSTLGKQLRLFGPNFGPAHLEVACGTGTLLKMMKGWRRRRRLAPSRIVGVDYAASMLAGARARFKGDAEIELVHADAADLPFDDNAFDTANIANAVHCLPDVDAALREVARVLKPGGTLAANVLLYPRGPWPLGWIAERINRWGMRKGILHTPYEEQDIRRRVESAGFVVSQAEVSGNCYNLLATKR
jgi:ubiquinone/menaquinone biosynthesis C-methylase UbiE